MTEDSEFNRLRRARQENAGAKYVGLDGRNFAFGRDNLIDVIEELADAVNIIEFLKERLKDHQRIFTTMLPVEIQQRLTILANECYDLRDWLPRELQQEDTDRSENILKERLLVGES